MRPSEFARDRPGSIRGLRIICSVVFLRSLSFGKTNLHVRILTPAIFAPSILGTYPFIGPGFDSGLLSIQERYPLLDFTRHVFFNKTFDNCTTWGDNEIDHAAAAYYGQGPKVNNSVASENTLTVIVTGGCVDSAALARLATNWNILFLTSVAAIPATGIRYPTWISTSTAPYTPYLKAVANLLVQFRWYSVAIAVDIGNNPYISALGSLLLNDLSRRPGFQTDLTKFNSSQTPVDFLSILARFRLFSRVYLFLGATSQVRPLLIAASQLNMTNGEYVYVVLGMNPSGRLGNDLRFDESAADYEILRLAFASVLLLEPSVSGGPKDVNSSTLDLFEKLWRRNSDEVYHFAYPPKVKMSPYPFTSYAAITILAQALNETLLSGIPVADGTVLAKLFHNRTFVTNVGKVTFNEFGIRSLPMIISQMDTAESNFTTKVRIVQQALGDRMTEMDNISWPGFWPVPNHPACGYDGHGCFISENSSLSIVVPTVALSVVLILLILMFRARIYQMDETKWLIPFPEIHIVKSCRR